MSETITTTQPRTRRHLLTYDDYLTFPDSDGIRKEIIEGELFMSPAPAMKHQSISKKIFRILDAHIIKNNLGEVWYAPCDVIFSNINIMQPDIFYISNENLEILTELNIKGAPDLIVEILSPSTIENDRIFKKLVYEKFGVQEYWIVDPQNETLEVWVLKDEKYQLYHRAKNDQNLKSYLFRDLKIDLIWIFK